MKGGFIMESNNKFNFNVVLSTVSLCFSVLSMFLMYYIFAGIALLTGIISINDEKSRKLSIASIILVCITFILWL